MAWNFILKCGCGFFCWLLEMIVGVNVSVMNKENLGGEEEDTYTLQTDSWEKQITMSVPWSLTITGNSGIWYAQVNDIPGRRSQIVIRLAIVLIPSSVCLDI